MCASLFRLNSTHPASIVAGIAGFVPPVSNSKTRQLQVATTTDLAIKQKRVFSSHISCFHIVCLNIDGLAMTCGTVSFGE